MAIITVSRQIASLGDEMCRSIAESLGYKFVNRSEIERKIIELGFSESKLKKFDERKPGFFASLSKDRDEYLDYLQAAIYESAKNDDCIIIGRGSFIILKDLPNHISLKFIAEKKLRVERYAKEHNCSEKQAVKVINESDMNRDGFNKSFFNFDRNDPAMFHLIVNTGLISIESITQGITQAVKAEITEEKALAGKKLMNELLMNQKIVLLLKYETGVSVRHLRTDVSDEKIILHGIFGSKADLAEAEKAVREKFSDYEVVSKFTVDEDYESEK